MVLTFVLYLTVFLNGLLSPVLRSIPWPLRWCNEGWLALELGNYSPVFLSFWHFWTQFLRSDYCRIHSLVMKLYILLLTDNPIKPWYLDDMLYLQVTELSIISVITVTAYIFDIFLGNVNSDSVQTELIPEWFSLTGEGRPHTGGGLTLTREGAECCVWS